MIDVNQDAGGIEFYVNRQGECATRR